jgi:5-methylcytosine-specific restriction protein B
MNTADRSIALIDKALRRRFEFFEVMPRYDLDGMDEEVADAGVSLAQVLETINDRIEYLLDREHQIGQGWLLHCDTKAKLDAAMRAKIIPLIAEYFFEDWGRTADVLGGRENNPFLDKQKLPVPRGLENAEDRFRWSVRDQFAPGAYTRLVAA